MAPPTRQKGSFESVEVIGDNPANTTLVVRAVASQTANLVEFQNSAGTVVGSIGAAGGAGAVTTARKINWANEYVARVSTDGTNSTPTAGTIYVSQVYVPATVSLTGVAVFNGTAVGTDKWIVALYSAAGVVLTSSALAGTTAVGTDTLQLVPFTGAYSAKGPECYFLSVSCNGNTARLNTQPYGVGYTTSQAGAFGTLDAITTPPSTFTADVGPIAATY